jgi:glyoxylase-like metal-dependent hydrolase (beta-lactamase superfamily II)
MNKALVDKREVSATEELEAGKGVFTVAPGVWRMKDIFVNVFIIQNRDATDWVLVDTGLKSSAAKVKKMAADIFGSTGKPAAIIMTHGHFDHRGSLQQLADEWGVPAYCHHMELPYLTGKASYPPADPTVGGGMMAYSSFLYPKSPIDVQEHLQELPENGTVPELSDWKWIHTPGHTPGHISLFRERDGVLIAGDAVVTTKQESVYAVMMQVEVLSGPPKYFTPDWGAAARSVKELAALEPNVIATGHGHAMYGDTARKALHKLARHFWKLGMPIKGRYVKEPALFNDEGPTYIPPSQNNLVYVRLAAAAALLLVGFYFYSKRKKGGIKGKINETIGKKLMKGAPKALSLPNPAPVA